MGKSDQVWDYEACDGPSWLWRSVLQVRREDQRSDPSTQIPRVEVFWNEDPRRTVVPMTVRHTCRRGEWRKQQKKLHQVWTTESTTVRCDHDDPSHGSSTQPRFGRFPVIRILVSLGFYFFINSSKNLVFEVRLCEIEHHIVRLCALCLKCLIVRDSYKWFLVINQANFRTLFFLIEVSTWILV